MNSRYAHNLIRLKVPENPATTIADAYLLLEEQVEKLKMIIRDRDRHYEGKNQLGAVKTLAAIGGIVVSSLDLFSDEIAEGVHGWVRYGENDGESGDTHPKETSSGPVV